MEKLNNPAILVVDMLNDFVTGALTWPNFWTLPARLVFP